MPVIFIFFFLRIILGKEDKKRFLEKFSIFSKKRPIGKIIWIHACSVGEVKSSYGIVKKFMKDNYKVLITTNTYLSSLDVKANLSKEVIHQYLPLDLNFLVKKFLKYWSPHKAIFIESELWPNFIYNSNKSNIPLCLIQAKLSNNSLKKWKLFNNFFKNILKKFTLIIPQSHLDKKI